MRTTTTLFLALFYSMRILHAQAPGDSLYMFFDDASDNLQLDSVYPAGCWQIGAPSKTVFTSAYSPGRALVTDTVLPYPDSTTCYAEFTLVSMDEAYMGRSVLYHQRLDMAPGNTAEVEVFDPWSMAWHRFGVGWDEWAYADNWNLANDGSGYFWSDTVSAWQEIWLESPCMGVLAGHDEEPDRWYEPEMRLRFVFKSQTNTEDRDGWMIDNLRAGVSLCAGGVAEETVSGFLMFPNPADTQLTLEPEDSWSKDVVVEMRRSDGALVKRKPWTGSKTMSLATSELPNGLYFVTVQSEGRSSSSRVVVQH